MGNSTLPAIIVQWFPDNIEQLEESLRSFCEITDVSVTFYNMDQEILWEQKKDNKICQFLHGYNQLGTPCRKGLESAIKLAVQLGEPYVFVCKSGFILIAFPLIAHGKGLGCFMAGPIIMGNPKEPIIQNLYSKRQIEENSVGKFTLLIRELKAWKPKEVSYLATLFGNTILSSITPNIEYENLKINYKKQNNPGIYHTNFSQTPQSVLYPYALETEFLKHAKEGHARQALETLQHLFSEMTLLEEEDLSQHAKAFIDTITNSISERRYEGSSQMIQLAIKYIHHSYSNKISLKTIADELHLNSSYLSTLFKQEIGVTFTDYLNQVRINHSALLLTTTTLNLVEISSQSGFDDQSYFSKVFKKIKGFTPKDYRKQFIADKSKQVVL